MGSFSCETKCLLFGVVDIMYDIHGVTAFYGDISFGQVKQ